MTCYISSHTPTATTATARLSVNPSQHGEEHCCAESSLCHFAVRTREPLPAFTVSSRSTDPHVHRSLPLQVPASCFPRTATSQEYPPSPLPQHDVSTALLQHKLVHNPESNTYHLPTQNTTLCPSTESIRQPRKLAVYLSL